MSIVGALSLKTERGPRWSRLEGKAGGKAALGFRPLLGVGFRST